MYLYSSLIDEERPRNGKQKAADGEIDWDDYYDLEAVYAWMDKLVEKYPNILKISINGYSAENRPIKMITLSKKPVSFLIKRSALSVLFCCYLIGQSCYYVGRNNTRSWMDINGNIHIHPQWITHIRRCGSQRYRWKYRLAHYTSKLIYSLD